MRNVPKKWIDYRAIRKSGLFDPVYYLLHNADVEQAGLDPLSHFLNQGWKEGRNPSADFEVRYYLETNPDVKNTRINPLIHYLKHGQREGRAPARTQNDQPSRIALGVREDPGTTPEQSRRQKSREIADVLDLLHLEPHLPSLSLDIPIDVLIPIYNGRELLEALLTSLVKNTSLPYRLLLADDQSSDSHMAAFLQEFKSRHPELEITLLQHEQNLGFVRTVNELAGLTQNHFVILNTDTDVPPHWLERLMYPILTNPQIASTTPFSNAGVICSFPNFLEDNPLFEDLDVATLDSFFQYVNVEKTEVDVPTGVGFCMGINKQVWNTVGNFDEVFGRGYGEENDWCMRASQAGYRNIIVPNLFVYHQHGGSFPNEEKKQLGEKNLALLGTMHPDYFARVADFIQRDPLKDLRTVLQVKILSHAEQPRIILDHALGGGANAYSSQLLSQENLAILITPDGEIPRNYIVRFAGQKLEEATFPMHNIRDMEQLLKHFQVKEILLNELLGYPKPKILEFVDFLVRFQQDHPCVKFTYIVHDYFGVCPIYTLLDYTIQYCGVPADLEYCDKCLRLNPLMDIVVPFVRQDYPGLTMVVWREAFGRLLDRSSRVICFSQSSKDLLQKAYPHLPEEKIEVAPHAVNWVRPVAIHKTSDELRIAVIGHLSTSKGIHIVYSLASYIDYYRLNAKIHIFGNILDPLDSFDLIKTVVKHGAFQKTDLPKLMEDNQIDLVLIPSIWPETFSYTAAEAMNMQLPVAVFDYGGPAERVRRYEKGIVLQKRDPGTMIREISQYFHKEVVLNSTIRNDITFVCVSNDDLVYTRGILSFAYMTEHPILKYDNREENVPIPIRYNEAIRTLLDSGYEGWIFFVHNDFSLLEPAKDLVDGLDHAQLYGPIGAVRKGNGKQLVGEILEGHNGKLISHGSRINKPTLVETVDCQCLLVHTDLLRAYPLRFDEHELLSFHQYVEELCIQARANYAIKTYAVPIQCKHASSGSLNRGLDLAIDYIHAKYPSIQWAGTCTHLWSGHQF